MSHCKPSCYNAFNDHYIVIELEALSSHSRGEKIGDHTHESLVPLHSYLLG